jgi:hypothetical protein
VVSFAMTSPLNVLILTAVLSSTGTESNALTRYGNWITVVGFFLIFGLLLLGEWMLIISVSIFAYGITFLFFCFFLNNGCYFIKTVKVVCCFFVPS